MIEEFILRGIDINDDRLPEGLCIRCRNIVSKYSKGKGPAEQLHLFNYNLLKTKPLTTLSCETICNMQLRCVQNCKSKYFF